MVHERGLPEGQGWSPITLFESTAALDAGPIYLQRTIGLCLEWFDRQRPLAGIVRAAVGGGQSARAG